MPVESRRLARTRFAGAWMLAAAAALVGLGLVASATAQAAPEPSPVPKRWQLNYEPGPLRLIYLDVGGERDRPFLYLTYKVTNNSGQDLLFAPSFELATSEGHLLRSGRDVPVEATRAILDALENPLLEDQIGIIDTLLQGPENAKQGLVVWPRPTP
jgi:hypothetical protein